MSKFYENQRVKVIRELQGYTGTSRIGRFGIVEKVLPNPYLPNWICLPNYLVRLDGEKQSDVFKQRELKDMIL
jgi:hypothetical protein